MIVKKSRKRETFKIFLIGIVVVILFLFYIWHHMEGVKLGYEIEKLKKERDKLKEEIKKLKLMKANYLKLERIEKIAIEKLKLQYPTQDQIIQVDKKRLKIKVEK